MTKREPSRYHPGKELRDKHEWMRKQRRNRHEVIKTYTQKDIDAKLYSQWNLCYWCFAPLHSYVIDHIVPLSRGGTSCKDNVVPVCFQCNAQKGAKLLFEWKRSSKCRLKRECNYSKMGKYCEGWNEVLEYRWNMQQRSK
jgi:5-methylcytosine-specific restriction endonuclease McrA